MFNGKIECVESFHPTRGLIHYARRCDARFLLNGLALDGTYSALDGIYSALDGTYSAHQGNDSLACVV